MKKFLGFLIIVIISISCKNTEQKQTEHAGDTRFKEIIHKDYELHKVLK